jgi:hypothetical protein
METFMGESNDLPTYYAAEVRRPVAEAALHNRNGITNALNANPTLGGGFVMTPDGSSGFIWRNNRYDIYLAIATEDENDVSWDNIPEGYVPEGFDRLMFDITIIGRQPQASYAPGEFSAARDAIKAIIANPPPAGAGRKRRNRKTRKGGKKHRTTRRK